MTDTQKPIVEDVLVAFAEKQVEQGKAIAVMSASFVNISDKLDEFIKTSTLALSSLTEIVTKSGSSNWKFLLTAVVGGAGIVALLFGGLYTIVDKNTQVLLSPVETKAEISERDRAELHKVQDETGHLANEQATEIAVLKNQNTELETQVRCLEGVRNVILAHQEQMNSTLSQTAGKMQLTLPPFNPSINCGGGFK
jgi:hypothetical protein